LFKKIAYDVIKQNLNSKKYEKTYFEEYKVVYECIYIYFRSKDMKEILQVIGSDEKIATWFNFHFDKFIFSTFCLAKRERDRERGRKVIRKGLRKCNNFGGLSFLPSSAADNKKMSSEEKKSRSVA
jgi:hypothetical protein